MLSVQFANTNVAKLRHAAMILERDVTATWHIFVGAREFVRRAVGIFSSFCPAIEIHRSDEFAVNRDQKLRAARRNHEMIPFAGRLHAVFYRRDDIVNRA